MIGVRVFSTSIGGDAHSLEARNDPRALDRRWLLDGDDRDCALGFDGGGGGGVT